MGLKQAAQDGGRIELGIIPHPNSKLLSSSNFGSSFFLRLIAFPAILCLK